MEHACFAVSWHLTFSEQSQDEQSADHKSNNILSIGSSPRHMLQLTPGHEWISVQDI